MWNEMSYNYYSHKNDSDRIRCEENDERQGMYRCCDCGIYMTFEDWYCDTASSVDDMFGLEVE